MKDATWCLARVMAQGATPLLRHRVWDNTRYGTSCSWTRQLNEHKTAQPEFTGYAGASGNKGRTNYDMTACPDTLVARGTHKNTSSHMSLCRTETSSLTCRLPNTPRYVMLLSLRCNQAACTTEVSCTCLRARTKPSARVGEGYPDIACLLACLPVNEDLTPTWYHTLKWRPTHGPL